jgi:hypothetical protein
MPSRLRVAYSRSAESWKTRSRALAASPKIAREMTRSLGAKLRDD